LCSGKKEAAQSAAKFGRKISKSTAKQTFAVAFFNITSSANMASLRIKNFNEIIIVIFDSGFFDACAWGVPTRILSN